MYPQLKFIGLSSILNMKNQFYYACVDFPLMEQNNHGCIDYFCPGIMVDFWSFIVAVNWASLINIPALIFMILG